MDRMSEENRDNIIKLMKIIVYVWGIRLSFLIFVYENDMFDVVVYFCLQRSVRDEWYNDLIFGILFFMMVIKIDQIRLDYVIIMC